MQKGARDEATVSTSVRMHFREIEEKTAKPPHLASFLGRSRSRRPRRSSRLLQADIREELNRERAWQSGGLGRGGVLQIDRFLSSALGGCGGLRLGLSVRHDEGFYCFERRAALLQHAESIETLRVSKLEKGIQDNSELTREDSSMPRRYWVRQRCSPS